MRAHGQSAKTRERAVAILCLAGAIACFGTVPIFIRHLSRYLDAWIVNGIRYSTAALILFPFVLVLQRRQRAFGGVWRAAIAPATVNLLGQILWGLTPYYNEACVINFVIRTTFLFTIIFSFLWLPGERALARFPAFWVGSAVCVCGVALMYGATLRRGVGSSPFGIMLIVATSVFWGLYAVFIKRCLHEYPARLGFGVVSLYTTAGLVVLMGLNGDFSRLRPLTVGNWGLLILSGILGIAIAHVLVFRAIRVLGPVAVYGADLLSPFVTLLGAMLFLGETMTSPQLLGGLALVVGTATLVLTQAWSGGKA